MSDLHPSARALIEAAKKRESPLSAGARARVHRSVLRRTVAFGAALASTGTASVAAKGGVLAILWASPFVSSSVIGALGGVALFVARSAWMTPAPPHPVAPAATQVVARGGHHGENAFEGSLREIPVALPALPSSAVSADWPSESVAVPPPPAPSSASAHPVSDAFPEPRRGFRPAFVAPDRRTESPEDGSQVAGVGERPVVEAIAAPTTLARGATSSSALITALEALHRIHTALRDGHPDEALEHLRANAALLEDGPLVEEAQAARVSALCQSGRAQEAGASIDHFLSAWPTSPLATRLREGCASLGGARVDSAK